MGSSCKLSLGYMLSNLSGLSGFPDDHRNHSHNGPFYFIKGVKNNKVRMKADALLIKNNISAS